MWRSGEKNTNQPAAQEPMNASQSVGRTPISAPSAPPRMPPTGSVPHTIQRTAAFIRPISSGGVTDCR